MSWSNGTLASLCTVNLTNNNKPLLGGYVPFTAACIATAGQSMLIMKEILLGKIMHRLTIIGITPGSHSARRLYTCRCVCGNKTIATAADLNSGKVKSCGCLRAEMASTRLRTHGVASSPLYATYKNMIARCYDPRNMSFRWYGGRGIRVAGEWRDSVIAFYSWSISSGWAPSLTIDRINNDGDYEPSNCRWISMPDQRLNTSRAVILTAFGISMPLMKWLEDDRCNISCYNTIRRRLKKGWTHEEAISIPAGQKKTRTNELT